MENFKMVHTVNLKEIIRNWSKFKTNNKTTRNLKLFPCEKHFFATVAVLYFHLFLFFVLVLYFQFCFGLSFFVLRLILHEAEI